ncbi:signal peptidase I [Leucobacter chromiiresistens]|uniref:Signal peptidase I n=1 Tax=Leucobacter chromiiresistens TaxID=1079994 RepID=A0A1H1BDC3_9MICO|nr:signal peptidase I [Leucobacter chromiiresistens]SDQ49964.1 signal peptidase, endoplasmic reticulum-type [Leucobacter chromiiresistens]
MTLQTSTPPTQETALGAGKPSIEMSPVLRTYAFVRSALLSVAAVIGVLCIVAFLAAILFKVQPVVVISGSMEPKLPVGSVVFVKPTPAGELEPGDIVTVERPRELGLVTHRLVEKEEIGSEGWALTLRGDANASDDPEPYNVKTAGKYVFHVVALGHLTLMMQDGGGWLFIAAFGIALLALFVLDPSKLARKTAGP